MYRNAARLVDYAMKGAVHHRANRESRIANHEPRPGTEECGIISR
jgi:hypothetical protein